MIVNIILSWLNFTWKCFHRLFSGFMLPTSLLLSLSLSTYAPLSAGCADVASCHSRSISLCSSLPKGLTLTHTHIRAHTQSRSHAHLCLPSSRRSTAPNGHALPVVSYEHPRPRILSLSSCRPLCQRGCSWKCWKCCSIAQVLCLLCSETTFVLFETSSRAMAVWTVKSVFIWSCRRLDGTDDCCHSSVSIWPENAEDDNSSMQANLIGIWIHLFQLNWNRRVKIDQCSKWRGFGSRC